MAPVSVAHAVPAELNIQIEIAGR